jgi:hypothetical protein
MRFLLSFLTVCQCLATDYFVRPEGNNSHSGLANNAAQAWATVAYAASRVAAGDTVHIGDGRYTGSVSLQTSGRSGSPITFTGTTNAWVDGQINWSASYVTLDGVRVGVTNRTRGWPSATGSGMPYGHINLTGTASYNRIINCLMDSGARQGLRINPGHGSFVYFNALANSYNVVSNNFIRGVNWTKGIFQIWGTGNVFARNTVTQTYDCDTFYINGFDHLITGNTVSSNLVVDATGGGIEEQHADVFQFTAAHPTSNVVMELNHVYDTQCQLGFATSSGSTLAQQGIWRNNVFANISSYLRVSIPHSKVYNNVFYHCGYSVGGRPLEIGGTGDYCSDYLEIKNNVFLDYSGAGFAWTDHGGYVGFVHSHNYSANAAFSPKNVGTEVGKIDGGDPKFASIALHDFKLLPGSVLIDTGETLSGFSNDFEGEPRPQGAAWDIGAYEFNAMRTRFSVAPQRTTGGWMLDITGPVNTWVHLDRSGNLRDWEEVWSGFMLGTSQQVTTDDAGDAMFYRMRVP